MTDLSNIKNIKLKRAFILIITPILFLISGNLLSQEGVNEYDKMYGPDEVLYNGKKYTYFLPAGTEGNQFFASPQYTIGTVTIKDKIFTGLALNFDIYNQQLLMTYKNENGITEIIEISQAWLKGFHLLEKDFILINKDGESKFYQMLGNRSAKFLYYWYKTMKLDMKYSAQNYVFSAANRIVYLYYDGKTIPCRNKRSFKSMFDDEKWAGIRSYMHKNNIRLKKASDNKMTDFADFIDSL